MPDKERMRNDVVMNDRFNRGLARKARKGDRNSQILLANIQSGAVDFTGSFGIRNANQDRDLNIGQNRVDVKNQGMWADQGAGDIPEPGQAPKAAEPQRQVNPNSKLGAGNGYAGNGQPSNGKSIQNPGAPAARAELANGTLAEQQEAIDNGGMAPSATRPAATSPASRVFAGNGNEVPVNSDGTRKPSFQEIEDAARERSTKSGAFGKVDKDGKLIKTDYAKVAQDAFKEDLGKSDLIAKGRAYQGDLAGPEAEEVKAAQAKALERGLSLGGNREQLQAMIGMETDSAAIERKAGEASIKEQMPKGLSENTKKLLLEAKQKAAARTGYTGEVTADTDFGAEAKALIPGAKKEIQAIIDARDAFRGKGPQAWEAYRKNRETITGEKIDSSNPDALDRESQLYFDINGKAAGVGFSGYGNDKAFQKDTDRLKQFRGAPSMTDDQMRIVREAPSVGAEKDDSIDPFPTGNPLFDNPNAPSVAWNNSAKPVETPKSNPKAKPKEDVSAYAGGSPLGAQALDVLGMAIKTPQLIGEKILQTTVKGYGDMPKTPQEIQQSQNQYASERVKDLRTRAEKIDTTSIFGKTKKANLLKAADDFEGTIKRDPNEKQAVEQRKVSENTSKVVNQAAAVPRKIEDLNNWFNSTLVMT